MRFDKLPTYCSRHCKYQQSIQKLNYVCENEDEQKVIELRKQLELFPISSSAESHRQN